MPVLPWRPHCSNQNVNISILVEGKQLAFPPTDSDGQGLPYSSRHPLGFICGFSVLWNFGNDSASPGLRSINSLRWSNSFPVLPSLHTHLMPFFIHVSLSCLHSGYFHPTRAIPGSSSNTTNSLFFSPPDLPWPFSYVDHAQNSISSPISSPLHSCSKLPFICSSISGFVAGSLCVFLAVRLNILLGL